ncbi:MAG: type I-E CRISPR-associated protein Cas6/Cse3/CasE [Gammaproteobacteria bacterium]|nr:type I-E CRISPR-associated protein Cas6/Cse3/CasE [Gammaproteobacteria bacterium]
MTGTLYLSRARLRGDASVKALVPLMFGDGGLARGGGQPGHSLIWSLFADDAERQRDFLWREMERGLFYVLSARRPEDRHGLFELSPPKVFAPDLVEGDRLGFSLRANPVVRRRNAARGRSVKHDVVMDALSSAGEGSWADLRNPIIQDRGFSWLRRQGERAGFDVAERSVRIDGYEQHRIGRRRAPTMAYSSLDYDGILTVTTPEVFVEAISRGFGAAKAYGCGLMLIRRYDAQRLSA